MIAFQLKRRSCLSVPLLGIFLSLAVGCGAVVHPPAKAVDPVAVYVADYGVHSAVMLPLNDGRYVEYAFGDWGYCAYNKAAINDALGALLLSSESAFGRRFIEKNPGQAYPTPHAPLPKKIFAVYASRSDVQAIERKFAQRFQKYASTKVYNYDNDTDYVHDDEHYSFINSCNHLTANTLRSLGCEVDGWAVFSNFRYSPTPAHDSRQLAAPPPPSVTALSTQ